jgi:hypothetical protein
MSDVAVTKLALEEIQRCLKDYASGWKNEEARQTINRLIQKIEAEVGWSPYVSEKLVSLTGWVDCLYSVKKWKPWGSTEQVRYFAFLECEKIRMYMPQIELIEAANSNASQ